MTGPIADSIETISGVLRSFFMAERVAAEGGFLQERDARVAVLSVFGLALSVIITRTIVVVLVLGSLTAVLAWLSSVPLRHLFARSLVVPLTAALIVLPQTILMPGDVFVEVFGLTITATGVAYVVLFTLRVSVSVSLLSLLVLTTPFSAIIAALRDLRIPITLVWIIAITYRYLFLFFDELQRLILARNSRTTGMVGAKKNWRDARRITGSFLLRTLDRSERVGRGMRARGGAHPPSPYRKSQSIDAYDWLLVLVALVTIAGSGVIRWLQ